MLGAVFGDIVGSAYEWNNVKTKSFLLETSHTRYTDDTVMTLAVAKWLMEDPNHTEEGLVRQMQRLGRSHLRAGYGGRFQEWLLSKDPRPYGSWGNGSAMRVSPVGLYASSVEEARELARVSASVTHNHPEGIKGAMAVAECVFLNKDRLKGKLDHKVIKAYIKFNIQKKYGYDLSRKLDDIRPNYKFDVSCQGSVPEAIIAYLESDSLEDCVRNAVSIGGDSDTIAAIACSIYAANKEGWDEPLMSQFTKYLPDDLLTIMKSFEELVFPDRKALMMWTLGLGDSSKRFAGENPLPKKDKVATKDSWKIQPMGKHVVIPFDYFLPEDVMAVVRYGHIPAAMEDHWFMYCDENSIRYYRSWTGLCVFIAEFENVDGGIRIVRLLSCRDSERDDYQRDTKDAALFLALLTQEYGGDSSDFWNVYFEGK